MTKREAKPTDTVWYVVQTNIKCEARAEKALRAARYRVYAPKMKKTIIHHRTKEYIDRTFALFNRYLFVGAPRGKIDWFVVRSRDGVEKVLGIDGVPISVDRKLIGDVMLAQRRGAFNDLISKSKRATIEKRHPIGSRLMVRPNTPFPGFHGQVTGVTGRGTVKALIQVLGRLTPVELKPEDITAITLDDRERAA